MEALRAESVEPLPTRWKPVDLVSAQGDSEFLVRTKLARAPESVAVCIAEAVSHAILSLIGFRMADGFQVQVGAAFADDLSAQYGFDPGVMPGRHWGTMLMRRSALEVEFTDDLVDELSDPVELFRLYVADVVIANPDRRTHGNILLATRSRARSFDLIPIDQSDAFFHPSTLLDADDLWDRRNESAAEMLDGTEGVLLAAGPGVVEEIFDLIRGSKNRMAGAVEAAAGEWYDRIGLDPERLARFLEYRVDNLKDLAREDHWKGLSALGDGGYDLDFGI